MSASWIIIKFILFIISKQWSILLNIKSLSDIMLAFWHNSSSKRVCFCHSHAMQHTQWNECSIHWASPHYASNAQPMHIHEFRMLISGYPCASCPDIIQLCHAPEFKALISHNGNEGTLMEFRMLIGGYPCASCPGIIWLRHAPEFKALISYNSDEDTLMKPVINYIFFGFFSDIISKGYVKHNLKVLTMLIIAIQFTLISQPNGNT